MTRNKKNKHSEMTSRSFFCEVRAEETESGSIITGRPVVYDRMTDLGCFNEIIEQGALDDCDLTDVRFLVNHDTSKIPLARSRKNTKNSTMRLTVDKEGLSIRVILDVENNSEARALYSAVKRGDITGMSFMFVISDEEWEDIESEHPTRRIKAIDTVIEVSAVTFPAYSDTEIDARDKMMLDNVRSAVETARQSQRSKSVETDLELLKLKTEILTRM